MVTTTFKSTKKVMVSTVFRKNHFSTDIHLMKIENPIVSTRVLNQDAYSLEKLKLNKHKLNSFKNLDKGWNGYEGATFDHQVIRQVEKLLGCFVIQPQIFPTSRGTIQIEKYFSEDHFYEVEIGKDEVFVYIVSNGREIERQVELDELTDLLASTNCL